MPSFSDERDVSDVMARMDRFRHVEQEGKQEKSAAGSKMLLLLSCFLSAFSILLFMSTLSVLCVPDSSFARLVISICDSLF